MKIRVDGADIPLRSKDVEIAQQVVQRFLNTVKEGAAGNNMPTLYITVLAVMEIKARELLSSIDQKQLTEVVKLLSR